MDVTTEGIRPRVAMASTGAERMRVSPARYVRRSLGVPGMRNTTSISSSRWRALVIQPKRSRLEPPRTKAAALRPQRRTTQKMTEVATAEATRHSAVPSQKPKA